MTEMTEKYLDNYFMKWRPHHLLIGCPLGFMLADGSREVRICVFLVLIGLLFQQRFFYIAMKKIFQFLKS